MGSNSMQGNLGWLFAPGASVSPGCTVGFNRWLHEPSIYDVLMSMRKFSSSHCSSPGGPPWPQSQRGTWGTQLVQGTQTPQAKESGPKVPLLPVTSCRWQGTGLDIGETWVNGSQLCDSGQGCWFCLEHFSPILPWRQTPTHPSGPRSQVSPLLGSLPGFPKHLPCPRACSTGPECGRCFSPQCAPQSEAV